MPFVAEKRDQHAPRYKSPTSSQSQANDIFKNLTHPQGRIDDDHNNYYFHEENVDSVIARRGSGMFHTMNAVKDPILQGESALTSS